jgi:hypothetical protein
MTSHDATATSMISPTISESLGITPTLQLSTSPDVPELKAELYAFFGGGGPSCAFGPAQGDSPEIQFLSHSFPAPAQDTILCLYNFPLNAEVTVEMIDPSGHTAEQKIYRVGSQLVKYEYASVQEFSLLEIPISFPLTLTSGAWQVLASSDGAQAEGTFLIGEYDPANPEFRPEAPFVTHSPILPAADITPMNPTRSISGR